MKIDFTEDEVRDILTALELSGISSRNDNGKLYSKIERALEIAQAAKNEDLL